MYIEGALLGQDLQNTMDGSGCWMCAYVRVEGSHHLSDRETVPEVVEWVITIVLLYLQLCMVCVCVCMVGGGRVRSKEALRVDSGS